MQEVFKFEKEKDFLKSLGSSVVERYPEEVGVRCSIHRLGTA